MTATAALELVLCTSEIRLLAIGARQGYRLIGAEMTAQGCVCGTGWPHDDPMVHQGLEPAR
jgi:hypothetical protein